MPVLIVKAPSTSPSLVIQAAERMEGKIKQAFLNAVAKLKSQIPLSKLENAISSGDINEALSLLAIDKNFTNILQGKDLESNITSVRMALQETFVAGANAALQSLPKRVSIQTSFNLNNPESIRFLDTYSMNLIKGISKETAEAVRSVVARAFKEGGSPAAQAREIRDVVGLTPRMELAVKNYRTALEQGNASNLKDALSRSLRDGRYDSSLLRSLQSGIELKQPQIENMVQRYTERYLSHRATSIARTESIRASSKGQATLWQQANAKGLLPKNTVRRWVASGDGRMCDICDGLDEETAPLDEEFEPGIMEPPDPHPDCRCSLVLEFGEEAA